MIRSMSDEQIEAAEIARNGVGYDKEPWVNARGERFATFNEGADASDPFDRSGALRLDPRPECIPSPDAYPWREKRRKTFRYKTSFSFSRKVLVYHPRPWGSFTPDPEFVRSEVNPILSAFRGYNLDHRIDARTATDFWLFAIASWEAFGGTNEWDQEGHNFHALTFATPGQVESARKVLTRLCDVMEASNA